MEWTGRDIVSIRDLPRPQIDELLKAAESYVPVARGEKRRNSLEGKILASLFFEPSTRTRLSFEAAMQRLGGRVVGFSDPTTSSQKKGETLTDTVRIADGVADAIVLRHTKEGSARLAADEARHPVINAGDGAGEHPTQTLLDLFTIKHERKSIDGNTIALVGDLKFGRTVHSLAVALAGYDCRLVMVAPPALKMPKEVLKQCQAGTAKVEETTSLSKAVEEADVLYMTRIQAERFGDPEEYRKVTGTYQVNSQSLTKAKKDLIVMHPLPRVDEIHPEIDAGPHARYFQQAANGVPVRMALLDRLLGGA
jgi:aspartate carbamoyltransferase catalytic subunit